MELVTNSSPHPQDLRVSTGSYFWVPLHARIGRTFSRVELTSDSQVLVTEVAYVAQSVQRLDNGLVDG